MPRFTTTEKAAAELGYYVREGSFQGTPDDRLGRWYFGHRDDASFRPYGPGYRTQREAWAAAMDHARETGRTLREIIDNDPWEYDVEYRLRDQPDSLAIRGISSEHAAQMVARLYEGAAWGDVVSVTARKTDVKRDTRTIAEIEANVIA